MKVTNTANEIVQGLRKALATTLSYSDQKLYAPFSASAMPRVVVRGNR
jgi:hypothetical protein